MRDENKMRMREEGRINTHDLHYLFPIDSLWINPSIELTDGVLEWKLGTCGRSVSAPKDLLHRFLKLSDAEPEAILNFAQRWGALGICMHGLPCAHALNPAFQTRIGKTPAYNLCEPLSIESIEHWRIWSKKFNALLDIAAYLNQGKHGKISDWRLIFEDTGWGNKEYYLGSDEADQDLETIYKGYWKSREFALERMWLMDVINNYLDLSRVRPRLELLDDKYQAIRPHVSLAGERNSALLGVLAIQLLVTVSRADAPAVCSECGEKYSPKRRPKTGQSNYCPKQSCQNAARREASRRYRSNLNRKNAKAVAGKGGR